MFLVGAYSGKFGMGDLRWTSGGGSTHLRRDARVGATVAFPRYWGQAKGSPEAAKEAQRAPFWMHCFFSEKNRSGEREKMEKCLQVETKMGIIDIQKCQRHGFFSQTNDVSK